MDLIKEYGLDIWVNDVINSLKGRELPLEFFYESRSGFADLEPLASELTNALPNEVNDEERETYNHFFTMTIAFLESCCNKEDKIIKNINLLSTVVLSSPNEPSTFAIMTENQVETYRTKTEKKFFERCRLERDLFYQKLSLPYDEKFFESNVAFAIDQFLISRGCILSKEQFEKSDIKSFLDYTKTYILKTHRNTLEAINES